MDELNVSVFLYSGINDPARTIPQDAWGKLLDELVLTDEQKIDPPDTVINSEFGTVSARGDAGTSLEGDVFFYSSQVFLTQDSEDKFMIYKVVMDQDGTNWVGGTITPDDYIAWVKKLQILSTSEIEYLTSLKSTAAQTLPQITPYFTREVDYWNWLPAAAGSFNATQVNNCYNYAVSLRTNSFAQPGRGSGIFGLNLLNQAVVTLASQNDGLVPLPGGFPPEPLLRGSSGALVALVMGLDAAGVNNVDFHWLRLSRYGPGTNNYTWTDKPGGNPARRVGNTVAYANIGVELGNILAVGGGLAYPGGANFATYFYADPMFATIR